MPLDSSIALQVRPPVDPMESMGKVMTLKQLAMQIDQAQRQQDEMRMQGDMYKNAIDPTTGKVDSTKMIQGMANAGIGYRIPAYQKQIAEADKSAAELGKVKADTDAKTFETVKGRLNLLQGTVSSLAAKPDLTHQDVISAAAWLVQAGAIPEDQAVAFIRQLPGDPSRLKQSLINVGLQAVDAGKRLEMLTPKFQQMDNGGAIVTGTVDPMTGKFTPGQAVQKTVTPDAQLSANVTMRGQNMTDSRERSLASQGVTYQQDANGNYVALPSKMPANGQVTGRTVTGPDGQPLAGNKALTETQGKSTGFALRAANSSKILEDVGKSGDVQPGIIKRTAEAMPIGGEALGTTLNWTQSPQQQQVEQAQRDFVNAILRQESGAAISQSEFENAKKQYFPQPGDSKAVIQQKKMNRDLAIKGLEISAGPGIKQAGAASTTGPKVGAVEDGYLYTGGDPASQSSWKKVGK